MLGDVPVGDVAAAMPDHEEHVEQAEARRRHGEEVHRGDDLAMVLHEGAPVLATLRPRGQPAEVSRHGAFGDLEAEAQQLTVNPWRTPVVLGSHPADEIAHFARHHGSAAPHAASRKPLPVEPETSPVPADHGLVLHDDEDLCPARAERAEGQS